MVTRWKYIGGPLCLDFVNTVGGWVTGPSGERDYADAILREKFLRYEDLPAWAENAGVLSQKQSRELRVRAAGDARTAAKALAQALEFRHALYRIFKSVIEGWKPQADDRQVLERQAAMARTHERLTYAGGSFRWKWDDSVPSLDRILWPIAASAAELLISNNLGMIRQCGGDECGWLFLDTSRNHSRHWCNMKECGNRAKVRRFRQRRERRSIGFR